MDDCIEWPGHRNRHGYGIITRHEREYFAHRIEWMNHHGTIPDGLCVCHRCDNPPCVNIEHLWLGTLADNNRDKLEKGRARSGINNKITPSEVAEIRRLRAEGMKLREIAALYPICLGQVHRIVRGHRWSTVPPEAEEPSAAPAGEAAGPSAERPGRESLA